MSAAAQREGFKAGEAGGGLGDQRQGKQVQPGAKAEFCDVKAGGQAGGQVVAGQKDVAGLGQAIVFREIRIVEAGRDGDHAVLPRQGRL